MSKKSDDVYSKIWNLALNRGFFWQSSEIYGGVGGFIDLGPLGVSLKNKIVEKWRSLFIKPHQGFIVEIETPVITPERVLVASGHVESFTDYIVECMNCGRKFRADHLIEDATGLSGLEGLPTDELDEIIRRHGVKCPECGGVLGKVEKFNLLFRTNIGPYSENIGYARPETAQGMFTSFMRVYEAMRRRLPLGIAQIGRVMRNEISPRQGPIRLREFTVMEIELFYDPENPACPLLDRVGDVELRLLTEEDVVKGVKEPRVVSVSEAVEKGYVMNEWNAYFMALSKIFVCGLGVPEDKQRFLAKLPYERAHYAAQTYDHQVLTSRWGWVEVSGHAYRTDYDLRQHMKYSGQDLRAYRLLPQPIRKKVVTVKPNRASIGRNFRKKAKAIFEMLKRLSEEEVLSQLSERGVVDLGDVKLDKSYFVVEEREEIVTMTRFIPHVAEPSFGVERLLYVTLEYSYHERDGRVVLRIPRDLAPVQAAVFPLVSKQPLIAVAKRIYRELVDRGFNVVYDEEGSIGKRYARVDEIGVPFAVTVDYRTIEDDTVTIRDRDTWEQVRIRIEELSNFIKRELSQTRKNLGG